MCIKHSAISFLVRIWYACDFGWYFVNFPGFFKIPFYPDPGGRSETNLYGFGFETNLYGFGFETNLYGSGFETNLYGSEFETNLYGFGFETNLYGSEFETLV